MRLSSIVQIIGEFLLFSRIGFEKYSCVFMIISKFRLTSFFGRVLGQETKSKQLNNSRKRRDSIAWTSQKKKRRKRLKNTRRKSDQDTWSIWEWINIHRKSQTGAIRSRTNNRDGSWILKMKSVIKEAAVERSPRFNSGNE